MTDRQHSSNQPFIVATMLSALLHGAVFLVAALFVDMVVDGRLMDRMLQLELVAQSEQHDSQQQAQPVAVQGADQDAEQGHASVSTSDAVFQAPALILASTPVTMSTLNPGSMPENPVDTVHRETVKQDISRVVEVKPAQLSTNIEPATTDTNRSLLIELLHRQISNHKTYPYLARKQRREGVAKVGFVLSPEGDISHMQLLKTSRTRALDRAALKAVKNIQPFNVAGQYIDTKQSFEVDVVFELM